jgi:DNA-binding MarR family transcriptional regulator
MFHLQNGEASSKRGTCFRFERSNARQLHSGPQRLRYRFTRSGIKMNLAREAMELLGQAARILWFEGTKHGMRDREWMALRFLSRANRFSRTPSALASYVGTTRGTASFIIGELERLGYLERKRSTKDKRSVMLSVTQQGKKFLARDPVNGLVDAIAVLDDDSKIRFRDTLRHVLNRADAAEQRHHTDVCKRCIFLREERTASENKTTVEFTCRLFRAPIAEAEIDLLCTSFEHHRQ